MSSEMTSPGRSEMRYGGRNCETLHAQACILEQPNIIKTMDGKESTELQSVSSDRVKQGEFQTAITTQHMGEQGVEA